VTDVTSIEEKASTAKGAKKKLAKDAKKNWGMRAGYVD
jgi:hypothetical protein